MSIEKKVYRFEPGGPADTGMPAIELEQADFQSELPEQRLHVYFEDEALGLSVGVWTTTDMQEAFGPYPGDEFMWVLEGQVDMMDGDGNATHVKQGETFCIRNGIPISWKQVGFLRKFYMTYDNPNAQTPDIASADGGVLVLDQAALQSGLTAMDSTEPFKVKGEAPLQHDNIAFTNDAGNMFVGMWDSTAFESEMQPFPSYEFVQLLEGEITITEGDGTTHLFKAGDVFFVPKGTICSWKTNGYVKKYYSILDI
ncbi:MAG: DUF861 domain-containing protein [Xanthomonadales bacterium]|nr:DUF861 domain-containing protein [Xanthomonadales bacterium]